MRKNRTQHGASEAFDLFLDTICNAFGGIVFILFLVALQLQLSGRPSFTVTKKQDDERTRQEESLAELENDLESLQEAQEAISAQVQSLVAKSDPDLVRRYTSLEGEQQRLKAEASSLRDEQQKSLQAVGDAEKRHQQTIAQKSELNKQITATKREAASRASRQQLKVRLPRGKAELLRLPIPVLVSGGRMGFVNVNDSRGNRGVLNTAEVEFGYDLVLNAKTCMLKSGAGLAIQEGDRFKSELRKQLSAFRPESHYFSIGVWPDSHAEFRILLEELSELKFSYDVTPIERGKPVGIGQGPGRTQ